MFTSTLPLYVFVCVCVLYQKTAAAMTAAQQVQMSSLYISRLCIVLSSASVVEFLHLDYEATALDGVDKDVTALEAGIV